MYILCVDADSEFDLQTQLDLSLDSETVSDFTLCHCHSLVSATARRCRKLAWAVGSYMVEGGLVFTFMLAIPIYSSLPGIHRAVPCSIYVWETGWRCR